MDKLAYVWVNTVCYHDIENVISYVKFFKQRGCKFCWHHLQTFGFTQGGFCENEDLKSSYNKEIFMDLPDDDKFKCVCKKIHKSHSLLDMLVIASRGINVDTYTDYGKQISYNDHLSNINKYIDELILWQVPFSEDPDSYYPISLFGDLLKDAFESKNLDDQVEKTINRVTLLVEQHIHG